LDRPDVEQEHSNSESEEDTNADPVMEEATAYGVTKVYLSERCSATGIPHLFFESHIIRKIIWLVILIFCTYRMIVESISAFEAYFAYPTSVSIAVSAPWS
jgi:hypothetical protein